MRKLLVLLVVIVAVGAGYYTYWHKKADEAQEAFRQFAVRLNTGVQPFTKDLPLLRYDSVSVTGFPAAMIVEVHKPVFNIPISAIIQELQRQKGITTPLPYEWVEEVSYDDKITLTENISGDHVTVTTNGDRTNKALVNHVARHTTLSSSSAPHTCAIDVRKTQGSLWTMQPAFGDVRDFFDNFLSFNCNVDGIAFKDAASGAPLYSMEKLSYSISNEASGPGSNRKMALKLDMKNGKATPAFDDIAYDYTLMFNTLMGMAEQTVKSPASEFGEQSMEIDVGYDGPTKGQDFNPGSNVRFDVNALNIKNALSDMTFAMHFASAQQGADRAFSLAMHGKSEVAERYDQLMQQQITAILKGLSKSPNPAKAATDPSADFIRKLAAPGAPEDVVAKLFPQFHTLGKTSFDLDLNIKGPSQGAGLFKSGSAALDHLDWIATPYGFTMKGTANAGGGAGAPPSGDLSITCISCDALVNDAGNYAMRIESVVDQYSNPPKTPSLTKDLFEGTKQFLHGISKNGPASDIAIDFVARGGMPTVSGKQLPEVLALYMSTIAPHLPQPSSAAGGQPGLSPSPGTGPEPTPPPSIPGQ